MWKKETSNKETRRKSPARWRNGQGTCLWSRKSEFESPEEPLPAGGIFSEQFTWKKLDGAPPVWFFHQQVVLCEPASSPPMHWKGQEELLDTSHAIDLWWLWEQMSPHPLLGWGPVSAWCGKIEHWEYLSISYLMECWPSQSSKSNHVWLWERNLSVPSIIAYDGLMWSCNIEIGRAHVWTPVTL